MNAKIRDAQVQKVPYMLGLGDRDAKANQVSVRLRLEEDPVALSIEGFVDRVKADIEERA